VTLHPLSRETPRDNFVTAQDTTFFFRLKSRFLWRMSLALVLSCAIVQIALGAKLLVLALAVTASVIGLSAFRMVGAYSAAGWLAFFFVLGNAIVAIVAKTILGQPLDSHLYSPVESFLALAAGSVELIVAAFISLVVPVGKPIFHPISNPRLLGRLSNWSFVIGALFWYLNRLFQDPDGSGFGGVTVFWNLVLMAVIARTALILERSDGRHSVDARLILILLGCVVMGLIDNQKAEIALPVVAYFATSLFYRNGITLRQIAVAGIGVAAMAGLVSPMVQAYRALGILEMPWQQRIKLVERGVKDVFLNGHLPRYEQLASTGAVASYYNYFGQGTKQVLLGRYASIQQIDPIIAEVSRHSPLGGDIIWPAFTRLIPSFIYPAKPRYVEDYYIVVQLGLIDPAGGKAPTVPLLAQSFAGYGLSGLLIIPLLTFVGFLLAFKKLGWNLRRNVFAVFFFCVFIVTYANQGDLNQYAGSVLRNFPLLATVVWFLTRTRRSAVRSPRVTALAAGEKWTHEGG